MTTDSQAIALIQELMDRREWSPDTLERIAEIIRATGRPVRDSEELR